MGYDTRRSSKHSIEFLTSWRPGFSGKHNEVFGYTHLSTEVIDPLSGLIGANSQAFFRSTPAEDFVTLPTPSFPNTSFPSSPYVQNYYNTNVGSDNQLSLYNGVAVAPLVSAGKTP